MLEFCSTLHTKLVGEWVGRTARGAGGGRDGSSRFVFARRDLAANQRVEVRAGLNVFDLLKDHSRFGAHLSADLLVILFGELSAFVLEIEILNIFFFFFNDPATTEIYTLSLHDALPI